MRIVALTSALMASAFLVACDNEPDLSQPMEDASNIQVTEPAQVDDSLGQSAVNQIPVPTDQPSNPAIQTTEGNTSPTPVIGENSFTMGEAQSHIESRGFVDVGELVLDEQGIWRGVATHNGTPVQVALDFQGNVFSE